MKKYECIKTLFVNEYDEDCRCTGEQLVVEVGTLWNVEENLGYNLIASKEALHLTLETKDSYKSDWIEVLPDTISNHFKLVT